MSLYEVSDVVPAPRFGRATSLAAATGPDDERSATRLLKPWERIAARIMVERGASCRASKEKDSHNPRSLQTLSLSLEAMMAKHLTLRLIETAFIFVAARKFMVVPDRKISVVPCGLPSSSYL
jgi:hypothetical protein